VGGFGGSEGLARYIETQGVGLLVNATHPFAATISRNALAAHLITGVPLLRLIRPPWTRHPEDRWTMVESASQAAARCRQRGGTAFLTLGVKELDRFRECAECRLIARVIELPDRSVLPGCTFIAEKGPFDLQAELNLMRRLGIDLLVAKQSGGTATRAKIDAARVLSIEVVMIERPAIARDPGCETRADVAGALEWVRSQAEALGMA
jgi:precorrin-6A/cobalt-precorrin-6A reductase